MASNTPVLSNDSLGMREILGDLAIASDSREELGRRASEIQDESTYRKFRLLELRKVMSEHTYRHRLAFIRNVLGAPGMETAPLPVCLAARADSPAERRMATASFERQKYADKRLILLGNEVAKRRVHILRFGGRP